MKIKVYARGFWMGGVFDGYDWYTACPCCGGFSGFFATWRFAYAWAYSHSRVGHCHPMPSPACPISYLAKDRR